MVGVVVGPVYSALFHRPFLPDVARHLSPAEVEAMLTSPTPAQFVRGAVILALGLGVGALLFGIVTIRARVLPAAGGWLLIAGAVLAAASELALLVRGAIRAQLRAGVHRARPSGPASSRRAERRVPVTDLRRLRRGFPRGGYVMLRRRLCGARLSARTGRVPVRLSARWSRVAWSRPLHGVRHGRRAAGAGSHPTGRTWPAMSGWPLTAADTRAARLPRTRR